MTKQWVNLKKKAAYVERGSPIERFGEVRFKYRTKKPDLLKFHISGSEAGKKGDYSPREIKFPAFQFRTSHGLNNANDTTGVAGTARLPAAGGATWTVSAKYGRKIVKGNTTLEAWRRIYCQSMAFAGCTPADLSPIKSLLEKYFIDLRIDAGAEISAKRRAKVIETNLGGEMAHRRALVKAAASAYTQKGYEPAAVAAVFVKTIARRELVRLPKSPKLKPQITASGDAFVEYDLPGKKPLWFGVEPEDDKQRGGRGVWFVSCLISDEKGNSQSPAPTDVALNASKVRSAAWKTAYGIRIMLPKVFHASRDIELELELYTIKSFSGGYSEPNVNVITVATEAWWTPSDVAKMQQIFNHELGHKLGMVPQGWSGQLDKATTLYGGSGKFDPNGKPIDQKGHQGPHCSEGCNYDAKRMRNGVPSLWEGVPACTMFGATGAFDPNAKPKPAAAAAPLDYCASCQELLRRTDLSGNLAGLKNSVTKGGP